jgi:hypothetical protein
MPASDAVALAKSAIGLPTDRIAKRSLPPLQPKYSPFRTHRSREVPNVLNEALDHGARRPTNEFMTILKDTSVALTTLHWGYA